MGQSCSRILCHRKRSNTKDDYVNPIPAHLTDALDINLSERPLETCEVCFASLPMNKISTLPCLHRYCSSCLDHVYNLSISQQTLFPPQCCYIELYFKLDRRHLPDTTIIAYLLKKEEHDTVDKTYCRKCSRWIHPMYIFDNTGFCKDCKSKTCTICKEKCHAGKECPKDPAIQVTERLGSQSGWKRCWKCKAMVELVAGCNKLT